MYAIGEQLQFKSMQTKEILTGTVVTTHEPMISKSGRVSLSNGTTLTKDYGIFWRDTKGIIYKELREN